MTLDIGYYWALFIGEYTPEVIYFNGDIVLRIGEVGSFDLNQFGSMTRIESKGDF
jgi:hypothetical protein